MNDRTNNGTDTEKIHLHPGVLNSFAEEVDQTIDSETLPTSEELTEESGKALIERDWQFNQRLVLPSEWNTNIKSFGISEIRSFDNESDEEIIARRIEAIYEDSPMIELLVRSRMIELRFEHTVNPHIEAESSSKRYFLEHPEITELGRRIGIAVEPGNRYLRIPIARRKLLKITAIEIQDEDFASLRFDWCWEPNETWNLLDRKSPMHQALPASFRERMEHKGLSMLIPVRLKRICKGVGDFCNTENGWQLFDTTFDEIVG